MQIARNTETGELVAVKVFNKKNVKEYSKEEVQQLLQIDGGERLINYLGHAETKNAAGRDKIYVFMTHAGFMSGSDAIAKLANMESSDPASANYIKKALYFEYTKAVVELHAKGLFHHDIKPDNFVQSTNKVYLVDYGFVSNALVKPSKGTPMFLPPEIMEIKQQNIADDQREYSSEKHDAFSLGLTLLMIKTNWLPVMNNGKKQYFPRSLPLNILGNERDVSFSRKGLCNGYDLSQHEALGGNTIDEVIALLLASDEALRITPTEALALPYFNGKYR